MSNDEEREMPNIDEEERRAKFEAWVRQRLDDSVDNILRRDIFENELLEARPAWSFPFAILIGVVREQGENGRSAWTIAAGGLFDYLSTTVAATPRDAARHFVLKWQLDAARDQESGDALAMQAEALFELVNNDVLWS